MLGLDRQPLSIIWKGQPPMTKLLCLVLGSALPAWVGWSLGESGGIMSGYWLAVIGFALGWYLSRKFVRDYLE